jgi:hypothetical protein
MTRTVNGMVSVLLIRTLQPSLLVGMHPRFSCLQERGQRVLALTVSSPDPVVAMRFSWFWHFLGNELFDIAVFFDHNCYHVSHSDTLRAVSAEFKLKEVLSNRTTVT